MAQIVGAHGVQGAVKIKPFGDNHRALTDYGALCDEARARSFKITSLHAHGTLWLAGIVGITDRSAAEKLRGTKLYLARTQLPALADEKTYYHADLIGLAAKDTAGRPLGTVVAVANFGAGDLLDVKPPKGNSFYVPFTHAVVPKVDIARKELIIDAPPGLID